MSLQARLRVERGVSLALITPDLGVVAGMADHLAVMTNGIWLPTEISPLT